MSHNLNYHLFVYGTLKAGQCNESRLWTFGDQVRYLGRAMTVEPSFEMFIKSTSYGIAPVIISNGNKQIMGEEYLVSKDVIDELDMYEGHPTCYERQSHLVYNMDTSDISACEVYVYQKYDFIVGHETVHGNNEWQMFYDYENPVSHRLFVYGTLKQGFINSLVMDESKFLGEAITEQSAFDMERVMSYPAVVDGGRKIIGELYRVPDDTLSFLDRLETFPFIFTRQRVFLDAHDEPAWMYLYNREIGEDKTGIEIDQELGTLKWTLK